ncbi:unnamed protein product [Prorocentrum cordatum]|uniref:HMG box domain-containing protein n=1 Tax=Prorocentrum cordatum TaxID=2364126 RepID=A0ABN9S4Q0_9DINO|nr:unnamed protein product [Polarella glacialis]
MGATAVNISHGVWDRGIFSAAWRLFHQSHQRAVEERVADMDEGGGRMLRLMSWVVGNGCCDHDCHGSLHRAFCGEMDDKLFMKSVYKQFASLRGGFSLLADNVYDWVGSNIVYQDWGLSEVEQVELWNVLGVKPEWVADLVDLQLRAEGTNVCVAAKCRGDARVIRRVVKCQLRLWQFRAWSESRWLSIGGQARRLMACLIVGIGALVEYCLTVKGQPTYNLGNFEPTSDVKAFLCAAGVASPVSERPLVLFFRDDRVPSIIEQVRGDVEDALDSLKMISPSVWETLSATVGVPARRLRHRSILAGHVQASYLIWRLSDARALPWSLCTGGIKANLAELAAGPRPDHDEGCSAKIWDLMRLGAPSEMLEEGVQLLSKLGHSSKRVEEGHVQGSRLLQFHKRHEEMTLISRAHVGQCRTLFATPPLQKSLGAANAKLVRLEKRNPEKIGGKQVYFSNMVSALQRKKAAGIRVPNDAVPHCVGKHGEWWNRLTDEKREKWRAQAVERRAEAWRELNGEIEQAVKKRRLVQEEIAKAYAGPVTLTRCRLTPSELQQFDDMWGDPRYSNREVTNVLGALLEPLEPLGQEELAQLATYTEPSSSRSLASPPWAQQLCRHRDAFTDCVLKLTYEDGFTCYLKFLWALQNPLVCAFIDVEPAGEMYAEAGPWGEDDDEWNHQFEELPMMYSFSSCDEYAGEDIQIEVLSDAILSVGGRLVSDATWVGLGDYLDMFPRGSPGADRASRPRMPPKSHFSEDLLKQYPWLLDIWSTRGAGSARAGEGRPGEGGGSGGGDASSDSDGVDEADGDLDEIDMDKVLEELEEKRKAEGKAAAEAEAHFHWVVRGGAWTAEHVGVAFDSFRATFKTPLGREMLRKYGFAQSCTFSLAKFGDEFARALAGYWVAKMTYFFDDWSAHGRGNYVFNVAFVNAFPEDAAFTRAYGLATPAQRVRFDELRALSPGPPRD